jgi:hypothetical protein
MLVLRSLQICALKDVKALTQQLARQWSPYLFGASGRDWESQLQYLDFSLGYPRLDWEKLMDFKDNNFEWTVDSYDPELTTFSEDVRAQLEARKDMDPATITTLVGDATETADCCGLENAIWDTITGISQSLAVWVPLCNEEGIAQSGVSGCDTAGTEWKQFKRAFNRYFAPKEIKDTAPADWFKADFWLETYAGNAGYGGEAGFVLPLDGSAIASWAELKSLPKVIRRQGTVYCETGVLTFGNGAGHLEAVPLNLSKYTAPRDERQAGIINNMVESVFGIVGFSSVNYGEGTRYTTNLWFPLKPQVEAEVEAEEGECAELEVSAHVA